MDKCRLIKLGWTYTGEEGNPNPIKPIWHLLIKRGNLEADMNTGRMPCEEEGRDWSSALTSQGTPKIASKPPETRGAHNLYL